VQQFLTINFGVAFTNVDMAISGGDLDSRASLQARI
jgi:hypothetical protein